MEKRELTCIGCPMGCQITVELEAGEVVSVTGNTCKIGENYAKNEVTHPERTVTSTAIILGGDKPRVSVKTASNIPKDKINDVMKEIDAAGILDMAMSGTTATLLARRWESAVLVNVDNVTLSRLMNSPEAMKALMSIEGFRSLNQDIETIINKSEQVKKIKRERGDDLSQKEKKELSDAEKEYKSKRKEIQQKLIKFATRIPVFMYLTDFREYSLKDVIVNLEPELFRKVTGLSIKDFELLVSLNVFNSELMNDAVYKFKRYEDSSLEYTGINTHHGTLIGGWDTVIDTSLIQTSIEKERDEKKAEQTNTEENNYTQGIEEEKTTPEWMNIKEGDKVFHKTFSEGFVTHIDSEYIMVKFPIKECKFKYPSIFEKGFLQKI